MSSKGRGNRTLPRWLRLAPVIAFASITLLAFNNCGSEKHIVLNDPSAGIPIEATSPTSLGGNGTDIGNPVFLGPGPVIVGLTELFCARATTCFGQTFANCSVTLQNTVLPGVTPLFGLPGPDSFLGVIQSQIDNKMLLVNASKLNSCEQAIGYYDCAGFPSNLFQDNPSLTAGAAAILSQINQCQGIVY